jgi:hypothetical protein
MQMSFLMITQQKEQENKELNKEKWRYHCENDNVDYFAYLESSYSRN